MKIRKNRFYIIGIVIVLFLIFSSFGSILKFFTDYLWFKEVGYTDTFLTKLKSQFLIGIPLFIFLTLLLYIFINKLRKKYYLESGYVVSAGNNKKINLWIKIVSVILSFLITLNIVSVLWFEILQFLNAESFNTFDPIFNNDISFYIFNLPLINSLVSFIINILFLLIVVNVLFYGYLAIKDSIKNISDQFDNQFFNKHIDFSSVLNRKFASQIINSISIIGSLVFIFLGIKYFLKSYDLLYSQLGRVFGASYTDINVTLNIYRILAVLCFISSVTFFMGAKKKSLKYSLIMPIFIIIFYVFGAGLGVAAEKFIVEPDQLSKETKYMEYSIKSTQKAYALEDVKTVQFSANDDLTRTDIDNNKDVIKNIKINDQDPLLQVYNQLQGIRPYYVFNDIDVDRYYINGEYKQVFLSARELDQKRLNDQAKTWVNQYLKYTHGYGITLSPVDRVTGQGQPEMLIKNLPPETNTDLKILRPEIYFGESTNNYIIVNTNEKEFDYPSGANNMETTYEGTAGIKLNLLNKLLFSTREGSYRILISNNINRNSKIIINRNIIKRVTEIAPFLIYDPNAYIVLNQEDGKLYWIVEAFTVSDRYPYSQPTSKFIEGMDVNYIRNSVKVVIDAYNGDTDFYIADDKDPIIRTYSKIFTDLFKPLSEMPQGIKDHIRYSQAYFDVQSDLYRLYHIENPTVFFGREDYWDIAKEKYMDHREESVESDFVMFKLHDEKNIEFLLTTQYTPQNKDNMIALLAARNDGENYGELVLYEFPKTKTIAGPNMIETKIDQDTVISSQLTLWGQAGSSVLRGNTLVIPINDSLLYIEPIYLKSDTESNFPEMKMVVASMGNQIVMESTLNKALDRLFGISEETGEKEPVSTEEEYLDQTVSNLIKEANELFIKADEASRNGDWAAYGDSISKLKTILNKLNTMVSSDNTPENVNLP